MSEATRDPHTDRLHTEWQQHLKVCRAAMEQLRSSLAPDQLVAVDTASIELATMPPVDSRPEPAVPHFALRV